MTGKQSASFAARVRALHRELGVPADYDERCRLPLFEEPLALVATEPDFYQRPQRLTPEAFTAWTAMKQAAAGAGVSLFLISAFRDLDYQAGLLRRKLDRGQSIEEILRINAAPGYSEHHSGRAVDIGTPGCDALVEAFEETEAFRWLQRHAADHGFRLSYPRDNPFGIDYEPWHWCFHEGLAEA